MEFCTSRSIGRIVCNCAHRQGLVKNQVLRNFKNITCGCYWSIRCRGITRSHHNFFDPVIITNIFRVYSNTYGPSYIDPFVLTQTRSDDYNACADRCLRRIMDQIYIDPFVNVRVMTELLNRDYLIETLLIGT